MNEVGELLANRTQITVVYLCEISISLLHGRTPRPETTRVSWQWHLTAVIDCVKKSYNVDQDFATCKPTDLFDPITTHAHTSRCQKLGNRAQARPRDRDGEFDFIRFRRHHFIFEYITTDQCDVSIDIFWNQKSIKCLRLLKNCKILFELENSALDILVQDWISHRLR